MHLVSSCDGPKMRSEHFDMYICGKNLLYPEFFVHLHDIFFINKLNDTTFGHKEFFIVSDVAEGAWPSMVADGES